VILAEGGNFNVMSKKQRNQYQCQTCGNLLWSKAPFNIEDDIFIKMKCGHCKKETDHIYVGENPEDVYLFGNSNLDERFYKNNTK
jgi:Zn finger protein HypA/HybF involved in hydrogenase expression